MTWQCSKSPCIAVNFAANESCAACGKDRPETIKNGISNQAYINAEWRELDRRKTAMLVNKTQDQIYKDHADFFNDETEKDKILDFNQIEERIQELEKIAFQAKARLSAATQLQREMKAVLDKDNRDKLIDHPNLLVSDSIAAVKKRADRMSPTEKLIEDMRKMKVPESEIAKLMIDVNVIAPEPLKLSKVIQASFNSGKKKEPAAEEIKEESTTPKEETKPEEIKADFLDIF